MVQAIVDRQYKEVLWMPLFAQTKMKHRRLKCCQKTFHLRSPIQMRPMGAPSAIVKSAQRDALEIASSLYAPIGSGTARIFRIRFTPSKNICDAKGSIS